MHTLNLIHTLTTGTKIRGWFFGGLNFGYMREREEYAIKRGWGIEWFSITPPGGKILGGLQACAPALE